MKRVAKVVMGWFFLILGVIGCFLPILQGILFMTIGLFFLAEESPLLKKHLRRYEQKYPERFQKMHAFRDAAKQKLRKLIWWRRKE